MGINDSRNNDLGGKLTGNFNDMELNQLIAKYREYKDILITVENGTWRLHKGRGNITISQLAQMRVIVKQLEDMGFSRYYGMGKDSSN